MATEVNQNYFAWSQEETSVQDISQGTSQVFGQGSISFGRFDLESLEWEKWSVFTNDRRHEEFGKFNGLVAKKKAYFEEYFKRIRELKALQQQNQQTELHLEYSGDGSNSSQTGEYDPAAGHGAPTEFGKPVDDSTEQTATATTFENEMESCGYNENRSLIHETSMSAHSSPVGGLQQIGKQMGDVSGKKDLLKQDANSIQDNPGMAHEIMISPNRITEKDSPIDQASKIIPKTIKMTSSNVSPHTIVTKGLGPGKPSVINQMAKPENIHSLRRPREATSNLIGATTRSGITGLRRPSSAASQRPSIRDPRPVTRDASRKPAEVITPCRPSTSERRPATRESALKHASNATPRRPSTADRLSMTKESAPKQCNIATPHQPSTANRCPATEELTPKQSKIATPHRPCTADRRPITKVSAPKHFSVASPHRPSTGERHTSNRDLAAKHVGIATSCRPSAVKQRPITREGAQKRADIAILCRPSTAERRLVVRDMASKHAAAAPPCRPSTAERGPIARDVALKHGSPYRPSTAEKRIVVRDTEPKHASLHRPSTPERHPVNRETALKQTNVATSHWPLTPDRCLTKKGDTSTPQRPSTGERRPIANRSTLKPNPNTPIGSRRMASYSKGAMEKEGAPEKAMTPSVVKSSKLENISYVKERVEFQVDGKQKSSFNLPTRTMLISNVRDHHGLENSRKSNKEGLRKGVRAQGYKSNNTTPSLTGRVKTRAPAPPRPPPPPHRPSCFEGKPNASNSPAVGRKPKASTRHWH